MKNVTPALSLIAVLISFAAIVSMNNTIDKQKVIIDGSEVLIAKQFDFIDRALAKAENYQADLTKCLGVKK